MPSHGSPSWESSYSPVILGQVHIRPMPPQIHRPSQIHHIRHTHQELANVIQLPIADIVDKTSAIDGILRMKQITRRTIINDDTLAQIPIQQGQVLDVVALVEDARFAEEAGAYDTVGIEEVEEYVGVLVEGGSIDDDLVVLGHFEEEVIDARAFRNVYKVDHIFDLNRNNKVGTRHRPKTGMHQRLIQIQHQTLLPPIIPMQLRQQLDPIRIIPIPQRRMLLQQKGGIVPPRRIPNGMRRSGIRVPPRLGAGTILVRIPHLGRARSIRCTVCGVPIGILGEETTAHHSKAVQ
mmetsp:Transcript_19250/g.41889  ORF Transcript_19250/g.41889 Transcript_19250/m.41889 type:complete len:293 (-) Transcript_19250:44-922(-)